MYVLCVCMYVCITRSCLCSRLCVFLLRFSLYSPASVKVPVSFDLTSTTNCIAHLPVCSHECSTAWYALMCMYTDVCLRVDCVCDRLADTACLHCQLCELQSSGAVAASRLDSPLTEIICAAPDSSMFAAFNNLSCTYVPTAAFTSKEKPPEWKPPTK